MKMHRPRYLVVFFILAALLSTASGPSSGMFSAARVDARVRDAASAALQSFVVLAGSTVTNTGSTTVNGDLGVSPGSAVTGFPPGIVTGTIHRGDAAAAQAQSGATAAYNDLASRECNTDLSGHNLGGRTLTAGVYCFSSSAQLTGELVLDAEGNRSAIFVFKIGSTLTTGSGSSVRMLNGGSQCNVFWQVGSSATLGTGTAFAGNIIALTSITLNTGASVNGKAVARNGAVTLDSNYVSGSCSSAPISSPTPTNVVSPTATSVQSATPTSTVSPTATGAASSTPTTAVQSPTPTGAPTTAAPTSAPTGAPTTAPTSAPPSAPTAAPSPTPTSAPTVVGFPVTGGATLQGEGQSAPLPSPVVPTSGQPFLSLGPLIDPGLDLLRAGPVDTPLELWIPSLQLSAPVVGVGITSKNVMDVPQGSAEDPVWQKAFWYRGGGIPGDLGTATIAGHVHGGGRPALFARLKDLRPGNLIIIHDTQSGLDVRFLVVRTESYSVQQAADPSVLVQIYGSGPVSGKGPQPAPDGLSHLTLITCGGNLIHGSYDHRLVVYSERVQAMPKGTQLRTDMPRWNSNNDDHLADLVVYPKALP